MVLYNITTSSFSTLINNMHNVFINNVVHLVSIINKPTTLMTTFYNNENI